MPVLGGPDKAEFMAANWYTSIPVPCTDTTCETVQRVLVLGFRGRVQIDPRSNVFFSRLKFNFIMN